MRSVCWHYLSSRVGQVLSSPIKTCRWHVLGEKKPPTFVGGWCSHYLSSWVGQVLSWRRNSPVDCSRRKKRARLSSDSVCWRYLSSRAVARQVLSAQMSLTSVFGMGTGGPSLQSTPTHMDGGNPSFISMPRRAFCRFSEVLVTHTGFEPMLTA